MGKKEIVDWLDEQRSFFADIAIQIWDNPELAFEEHASARLQGQVLADKGFRVTCGLGEIPTAFVAEYGAGKPVIGILGEFDALPGLSQKVSASREPVKEGAPGHACGHNLLGVAGLAAAVALSEAMKREGLSGTIRYYGCPAEEGGSGKTYMARAGAFDDLDAAFSWHPGTDNVPFNLPSLALTSIEYHFRGRSSHAGVSPHLGRSALDAVELMNVGANYLREHVPDSSRIHYIITNGGEAPNIVPDKASVLYYLRGTTRSDVDALVERVGKVAQGAALMTETEVSWRVESSVYDLNVNDTLNGLLYEQKEWLGEIPFTKEDEAFARQLHSTLDEAAKEHARQRLIRLELEPEDILPKTLVNYNPSLRRSGGSSNDVGDVSWVTPLGKFATTCAPSGVQVHTWQATAAFGSGIGLKGMHYAAKLFSLAIYELLVDDGERLRRARDEFRKTTGGRPYVSTLPPETKPPTAGS